MAGLHPAILLSNRAISQVTDGACLDPGLRRDGETVVSIFHHADRLSPPGKPQVKWQETIAPSRSERAMESNTKKSRAFAPGKCEDVRD
jgi:hypothetical protein